MKLRFAGVIWLVLTAPALAWGPEGHEIVAAIAAANLTPAAGAKVAALLGPPPMMVLESSWADEIRDDRPDTAAWHYVNVELGSLGYDTGRDCPDNDCVVAQLAKDMAVLGNARAPRDQRIEALRFLIHFVGDVHQPLHVGDNHDKGGNARILFLHGQRTNLHRVWDSDAVTALGPDPMRVAAGLLAGMTPQQKAKDGGGTPVSWVNESLAAAERIYAALPYGEEDLANDYPQRQGGMVRDQLRKAGLRLAATLNRLLK